MVLQITLLFGLRLNNKNPEDSNMEIAIICDIVKKYTNLTLKFIFNLIYLCHLTLYNPNPFTSVIYVYAQQSS